MNREAAAKRPQVVDIARCGGYRNERVSRLCGGFRNEILG